jgi:hypothetical protein
LNFYGVKICVNNANESTSTKARGKNKRSFGIKKDECLTELKKSNLRAEIRAENFIKNEAFNRVKPLC